MFTGKFTLMRGPGLRILAVVTRRIVAYRVAEFPAEELGHGGGMVYSMGAMGILPVIPALHCGTRRCTHSTELDGWICSAKVGVRCVLRGYRPIGRVCVAHAVFCPKESVDHDAKRPRSPRRAIPQSEPACRRPGICPQKRRSPANHPGKPRRRQDQPRRRLTRVLRSRDSELFEPGLSEAD